MRWWPAGRECAGDGEPPNQSDLVKPGTLPPHCSPQRDLMIPYYLAVYPSPPLCQLIPTARRDLGFLMVSASITYFCSKSFHSHFQAPVWTLSILLAGEAVTSLQVPVLWVQLLLLGLC